ncbi:hypothetical protein FJZ31_09535 [Candidatus Poribacteria bacterium]|nr:hypothetical protein [Candidatus Poribacteria bacterium]
MAEDKDKSTYIQDLTTGSHLILGKLLPEFANNIITLTEDNLEVILTWERRQHYLERHYEMFWHENLLIETVLSPDIVQRNSKDKDIALFFKKIDEEHYLRATILLNTAKEKDKKHSVLSYRIAGKMEVERGKLREVYRR